MFMKKISIILLLISGLFFTYSCGKKKIGNELSTSKNIKYVLANSGLRIRDVASTKGKKLGTIPENTGIEVLEETGEEITISNKTGKWTKVKWKNKEGWVFGGFLGTKEEFEERNKKHPLLRSFPERLVKAVMTETGDPNNPVDYAIETNCPMGNPGIKLYQENAKNKITLEPNIIPSGAVPSEITAATFVIQSITTKSEPSMMGPDGKPEKFLLLSLEKDASESGPMRDSFPDMMTVRIISLGQGLYEMSFEADQESTAMEQAFYIDEKKKSSLKQVPCQGKDKGSETGGGPGDDPGMGGGPGDDPGIDPYNDPHSNDAPM